MFVFERNIRDKSQVIVIGLVRVAFPFALPLLVSPLFYFFFLSIVSPLKLLLHDVVTSAFLFYFSIFCVICLSLSLLSFS